MVKKYYGIWVAVLLMVVMASCAKDPDIPTGDTGNFVSGTYDGHEYVDLGLPSGTLWATCNLGASSPEDYGDYYAWGETTTKSTYNWSTYQYCNGDGNKLTKYCSKSGYGNNGFTDNLTVLQSSDDAATVNWGSGWCIPTKKQWEELRNNTTVLWTTKNGEIGVKFFVKNGNSLFLPTAGYWTISGMGNFEYCYYWSKTLLVDDPRQAWDVFISQYDCTFSLLDRCYGSPVRPVRSTSKD